MNGIVRSLYKWTPNSGTRLKFGDPKVKNCLVVYNYSTNSCRSFRLFSIKNAGPVIASLRNNNTNNYCTKISEAEAELAKHLEKSILVQQAYQQIKTIPSRINDFQVSLNGAEVILMKNTPTEKIKVHFSVNYSLIDDEFKNEDVPELLSKPNFYVDIINNENILSFTCSYSPEDETSEGEVIHDLFSVDEITIYKGKKKKVDFVITGSMISYTMQNLLLNLLDEKGITNEFVYKVSELSTTYEHTLFVSLMSEFRKFLMHP